MSFWLNDSGFDKTTIGLFALANLLYAFKFLWGPVLEKISNTHNSNNMYKVLMLITLGGCITVLATLSTIIPEKKPILFFCGLVVLSFFAASYKMLLHASQMLLVKSGYWGFTEAACTIGFRIGMIASGAGALYLSTIIPWSQVYLLMSLFCIPSFIGIVYFSFDYPKNIDNEKISWKDRFSMPFLDFFLKEGWVQILFFMIIYRLQDGFLGKMPNLFFREMGFSKEVISFSYKLGGLFFVALGGLVGGYMCANIPYRKTFFWGLLLHGASGWVYLLLQNSPGDVFMLCIVVGIIEFTKGLTLSAFFSYQLNACSTQFAITQIAFLTSLVNLPHIALGAISGFMATYLGWTWFFICSSALSIPALIFIKKTPEFHKKNKK